MVWVKQGHAPCKTSGLKNPHCTNYCGHQLDQSLGWAAPACHKKEDATPHPGVGKHGLQYDRRPNGHFAVLVGTWNFGSLSRKGDICEELRKKMTDVCCLQQVGWR